MKESLPLINSLLEIDMNTLNIAGVKYCTTKSPAVTSVLNQERMIVFYATRFYSAESQNENANGHSSARK